MKPEDQLAGLCVANAELGLVVLDLLGKVGRLQDVARAAQALQLRFERDGHTFASDHDALAAAGSALLPGDLDAPPASSGPAVARMVAIAEVAAGRSSDERRADLFTATGVPGHLLRDPRMTVDAPPPEDLVEATRPPVCGHMHVEYPTGLDVGRCLDCHEAIGRMNVPPKGAPLGVPQSMCPHLHTTRTADGAAEACTGCGAEVPAL